jgi:3-hydroxybutyrate dehydrogenase
MLSDAVVLVTGGSRGIGRAIALAFARAGASVAVAARSEAGIGAVAREIGEAGGRALAVPCDVTDRASVERALDRARASLGPIDVLVNNAGWAESAPLARLDERAWERTLAVNMTGTYLCTRAVVPSMTERGRGRIINIASTAGQIGYAYTAAYCAAKHGVIGFTRAVARELATKGVTVNAICPGWVDTEMTAAAIDRIVETTGRSPAEARAELEAMSPQRRMIDPGEVAALAVFLAGDDARGITGQAISIDGGEVTS